VAAFLNSLCGSHKAGKGDAAAAPEAPAENEVVAQLLAALGVQPLAAPGALPPARVSFSR
jgi:hypothetical protein